MSKKIYTIFLDGEYESGQDEYYKRLIDRSTSVAVDGGIAIFERLGASPNILVGDFDTRPDAPEKYSGQAEIISSPAEKDQSDGELAVVLSAERGADEIILCGYSGGSDLDHQFANLLLLPRALQLGTDRGLPLKATAVKPGERVWYLEDDTVELVGNPGDLISVVPLNPTITLTVSGLKYDANTLIVKRGTTRSLRNELTGRGARITVYGAGLVFHRRRG